MSTRALIHIKDDPEFLGKGVTPKTLVTIFRHWDGYPECLGAELKEICAKATIINGISRQTIPTHFNGIGCFAAYLVGKLKGSEIGNVALHVPDSSDVWEEYVYTIRVRKNRKVWVSCREVR